MTLGIRLPEPTLTKVVPLGDGSRFRYFSDGAVFIDSALGTFELRSADEAAS